MKREEFEKLVNEALLVLPKRISQKITNTAICVERRPSEEQLKKTGLKYYGLLLGLYEGIPQTIWGKGFGGNLPDKITIFQESIEKLAGSPEEAKRTSSLLHLPSRSEGERRTNVLRTRLATRESVIRELVKNVVWHEVAHHFGFSERGIKLLQQKRDFKKGRSDN